MAKKKGLGRGIDALMSSGDIPETRTGTEAGRAEFKERLDLPKGVTADKNGTLWIDPTLLKPNPHQPRREFVKEDLQELSDSIRENGVLQPILIEDANDGTFYIIAGERRTRASIIAGLKKVPVLLGKFNEVKKLEIALIENIQREDLNPIDEARAYFKLMELGDLSQEDVARRVGKNRSTVANSMRLLKLPEDIQSSLISGQISAGHARALLSVENASDQRILFGKIVGNFLSVRDAEQLAAEYNGLKKKVLKAEKTEHKDPDLSAIEQKFIEALGTKVVIKGDLKAGSIRIDYFSKDDLDRLYSLFTIGERR
ncbi:ParB/RepB/Spo0J family partition protein [Treponema parvum]|uniref:ParB/RepB/Spo0J family partition protein n=1 Tax=Treponema parvum TaxID=138851 RepID=UPI001AEC13F1|nr:ParB/RepB/Spo0J family partition protein [Treponema parvum]QTQ15230.1 ParB/RepB/Spo0J family partition protein [Treponema parvum]